MVEIRVVFQQTLQDVIGVLVVDHLGQFGHDLLDERVNHVDRECLHAHIQHPAPLHILCQVDCVFVYHFKQGGVVPLDFKCIS